MFGSLIPGVAPLFEEREAARFEGYTPKEWYKMPYGERCLGVAHYRVHRLVELHENDAVAEHMKNQSKD